ncbi:regulatory signaling modulator protein AmpE [Marinibactrum halimedae]|uniref:Regulatory signaling modulator protein AmpE n=1 Tax=Marinibactrum halimedae TaxID=1444977 RepID=A0AA37TCJ9_9GAMM|nr:regulatory signaling modulator protein AmpE [Marinibactrum halimedae]MCD9460350.1 regulatory signaling modulator protein AmpE [Marinibactrum halimedae]GLS26787.1 hypothetical protein GCM10007877_25060 [Marinibactrum halimedae]
MQFIGIVLVLGLVQIWGSGAPLHRDRWFFDWISRVKAVEWLKLYPLSHFSVAIALPLILLLLLEGLFFSISIWLHLLLSVAVLTYCLGRGDFSMLCSRYMVAWSTGNWLQAVHEAGKANVDLSEIDDGDWAELHHRMVKALAYLGFERMFAVLFWYLILGLSGALVYRLASLYREETEDPIEYESIARLMWLMEWPAVRALGLSFALTGNFVSCFTRFRSHLTCVKTSTEHMLLMFVESALSVTQEDIENPRCGEHELRELERLFARTLVLWLCFVAVATVFW